MNLINTDFLKSQIYYLPTYQRTKPRKATYRHEHVDFRKEAQNSRRSKHQLLKRERYPNYFPYTQQVNCMSSKHQGFIDDQCRQLLAFLSPQTPIKQKDDDLTFQNRSSKHIKRGKVMEVNIPVVSVKICRTLQQWGYGSQHLYSSHNMTTTRHQRDSVSLI